MMPTYPLITHLVASQVFAWRDGVPVTAAQFLNEVAALGNLLPPGRHMLNACSDRYRFAVAFAAALVAGKICLLPSTHTPQTITQLQHFAPDVFCLTDDANCHIALPQMQFPSMTSAFVESENAPYAVQEIDAGQVAAYVFTSGSTGVPVPHEKTWGALVRNVRTEAALCGIDDGRSHALIGTVPPQHMYGFESTVLIVMQSANAMVAARTFYPIDICQAIENAPRPRVLVSTPIHMRAVIGAAVPVPAVDLILCATAPLSTPQAHQCETHFQAPLLEIYGSTETGQIAVRKPTRAPEWTLFDGLSLQQDGQSTWAVGGHLALATLLNDVIEIVDGERFLLHGRMADMINIAGKRSSLAYLNLQLNAIEGVLDGVFLMPENDVDELVPTQADTAVVRLTAFVVAPNLTKEAIMAALRQRIDAVFLPRPLLMVDALPRNETGKLPRQALQALVAHTPQAATKSGQVNIMLRANHAAFAGHFPGRPLVPGVVLLDEALYAIGCAVSIDLSECKIASVKFLSPVLPGEPLTVAYERTDATICFDLCSDSRRVATGVVQLPPARVSI